MDTSAAATAIGFVEHLQFFDHDGDGHISLRETHTGLRRLGFGYALTLPGAVVVNLGVSALGAAQGKPVDPSRLSIPRAGHVRHPDSFLVDREGRFDQARLDVAFARYGRTFGGHALTLRELARMAGWRAWRDAKSDGAGTLMTLTGFGAVALEWGALFWVAREKRDGRAVLEKSTVKRFYTDATFFDELASRLEQRRAERAASLAGRARNVLQSWLL